MTERSCILLVDKNRRSGAGSLATAPVVTS